MPISSVYTPDGKHIRNVCGAAEIVVVEGDQDTVFSPLKVKFKIADDHRARQAFRLFSSAPAIGDNADGEKQQTETSSQGSGPHDGLKRIEDALWRWYRVIRPDHELPPRTARTQYWIALCSTPTLPSKKYTVQALDGSAA